MKYSSLCFAAALLLVTVNSFAQTAHQWDFDRNSDREGWTVPADMGGTVMGGSLWLMLSPKERDPLKLASARFQVYGILEDIWKDPVPFLVASPGGLNLTPSVGPQWQVKMRVLNLSPVTDISVAWRTAGGAWVGKDKQLLHSQRCALKSDLKEWQELTCYLGKDIGETTVDQIGLLITQRTRGDLWIDRLQVVQGAPETDKVRPDLSSSRVVPALSLPGISQAGFAAAFKVLDQAMIVDVPMNGFTYPFNSPGGYYRDGGWWPLDTELALVGAKWVNPPFADNVMRGWRDVQRLDPDGRIDLWGNAAVRGQPADQSILPVFFEVAYNMARRTPDLALRSDIYETMKQYLDWWLSPVKRDAQTGLVWATFEESISGPSHMNGEKGFPEVQAHTIAATDTNVAVAVGAHDVAALAADLGKEDEARHYREMFTSLSSSINRYLWDDEKGAYFDYDLKKHSIDPGLSVTTFNALRVQIAPPDRRDRLLQKLLDPQQFNWGKRPLTSWAMTDPAFREAKGDYDGLAWFGDIWGLLNMIVVDGLDDSGRPDLAAELNWKTIQEFHNNYFEYLLPSSGKGEGTAEFTWSASLYIGAIIDHLFGIDVDAVGRRVRIAPHVPRELYGKDLALENVILPNNAATRLSVRVKQSSPNRATISVQITGPLPDGDLSVELPGTAKTLTAPMRRELTARFP